MCSGAEAWNKGVSSPEREGSQTHISERLTGSPFHSRDSNNSGGTTENCNGLAQPRWMPLGPAPKETGVNRKTCMVFNELWIQPLENST